MASLTINVSEAISVSESVILAITRLISTSEAVGVADTPTVAIAGNLTVSVSDAVLVSETIKRILSPITYSIDSGSEMHGIKSSWKRVVKRKNSDGTVTYSNHALNTWSIAIIGLTNFETLRATQGQALTSFETNDIDNYRSGKSYGTAKLEGVVNGQHQGIQMLGVKLIFRVDVS